MISADRRLDLVEQLRGLLDARADRRAHVQGDLAGIHRREEILAQERHQQRTTASTTARKPTTNSRARVQRQRQQRRDRRSRTRSKPRLEAALEPHQTDCAAAAACASPWPWTCVLRSRYIAMVGTRVRDRMKEAIMREHHRHRPSARTESPPRPAGRTSARRRCRCRAARRRPAARSAARRPGSRCRRPCPAPDAS